MPRFTIPSQDPADAQYYMSVPRRASMEELRSNTASPLLSVRGVYVRSRPSSPSPTFAPWPRPLPERPDEYAWRTGSAHQHLATSFASFDLREKKGIPGTPYPRGRMLSSASADDAHVGASRIAAPPPAYAIGSDEAPDDSDAEDEVLYMDDERREIEEEKTALLRESAALLYYKVERDGGHDSVSLADEPCPVSHWDGPLQHSVKFSRTDTLITFRRPSEDSRRSYSERDSWPDQSGDDEPHYAGSFFNHFDEEPEEKRKNGDNWSKTLRKLFKFNTSRKAAPPTEDIPSRTSSESAPYTPENVKESSASLFNLRIGPTRPPTPSAKSTRAPSIRSTSSGRNVLMKRRKANNAPISSTPEKAALTLSTRAVEGGMRPPLGVVL